jgi:hypothetical protein
MEETDEDIEEILDYLYSTGRFPTDNHYPGNSDDLTTSDLSD